MLRFFRLIRRKLIEEDNTRKYLFYAIGEILLVMIGILLALQVNNWSELKKERDTELEYLIGIKADLENDLPRIENRIQSTLNKISRLHVIDSTYVPGRGVQPIQISIDSTRLIQMFDRGPSIRLTEGTYNTLTSNTSAGLFKNVELFHSIQRLYDDRDQSTKSIYADIKRREEYVGWKYAYELKNSDIDSFFITNPNRQKVLADFDFYYKQQVLMHSHLIATRDLMVRIIEGIETELRKRNYMID